MAEKKRSEKRKTRKSKTEKRGGSRSRSSCGKNSHRNLKTQRCRCEKVCKI